MDSRCKVWEGGRTRSRPQLSFLDKSFDTCHSSFVYLYRVYLRSTPKHVSVSMNPYTKTPGIGLSSFESKPFHFKFPLPSLWRWSSVSVPSPVLPPLVHSPWLVFSSTFRINRLSVRCVSTWDLLYPSRDFVTPLCISVLHFSRLIDIRNLVFVLDSVLRSQTVSKVFRTVIKRWWRITGTVTLGRDPFYCNIIPFVCMYTSIVIYNRSTKVEPLSVPY